MIVFDVSALVGAAVRRDSVPELAFRWAIEHDTIAVSDAMLAELLDVLSRPRLRRFIDPTLRDEMEDGLAAMGLLFDVPATVTECRDPKDNLYLDLALAAQAHTIVSSDLDLLVLHPWRGVRVLRPAEYVRDVGASFPR